LTANYDIKSGRNKEKISKKYKILIVDDEPNIVELMKINLPPEAFIPVCAYDGKTAMQKARDEKPDLIILDILMPGLLNGWQVIKSLKSWHATSNIPIIIATGKDTLGDVDKGFALGIQDYITKPIDLDKLLNKIKDVLKIKS